LRQVQKCGGVKLVNAYGTQPFVVICDKMIVNKILLLMFKIKVHSRWRGEVIVCFGDIDGIVDHHCWTFFS
jgi:hypothetical protein